MSQSSASLAKLSAKPKDDILPSYITRAPWFHPSSPFPGWKRYLAEMRSISQDAMAREESMRKHARASGMREEVIYREILNKGLELNAARVSLSKKYFSIDMVAIWDG